MKHRDLKETLSARDSTGELHSISICGESCSRERPGTPHFQLYPEPPQQQRIDFSRFQRAMLAHIRPGMASPSPSHNESMIYVLIENASSVAASSIAVPNNSEQASVVSEIEQNITVDSDAESVDTTTAAVFGPVAKMKRALRKKESDGHGAGAV